jgi:hypothetical protein
VLATDEKAALAQAIESYRIPPHIQKRLIVTRVAQLTPAQFAKIGEAICGPSWRAALAIVPTGDEISF